MTISLTARPLFLEQDLYSPLEGCQRLAKKGWDTAHYLLDKHTDLVSSVGILAISTCILAAKIFKSTPAFIPRTANLIFNYGGIIWLNDQSRDLSKSCKDFTRSFENRQYVGMVETAAKVVYKAINILLTCVNFTAAVVTAVGFPHVSLAMYMAMRSVGLTSLALNIVADVRDYFVNNQLLTELDGLEKKASDDRQIAKVMTCFIETILEPKHVACQGLEQWKEEALLADKLVRQLDIYTLMTFKESLAKPKKDVDPRHESTKLYYAVQDSILSRQCYTKSNLFLTSLGYVSMGICRAFPETVLEKSVRWMMSVLYTDEIIRQKIFQSDLAGSL